jgi:glycosyltransferase involved in cell wall biosynthesis
MKILFIPHVPNLNVVNRVYEFSKATHGYFLYWEIDNSNLKNKLISQMKSLGFSRNDKIVQIPLLFKPEGLAIRFNTFSLNRLIDKLGIDVVVNANALLFDIQSIKVPVFYDMVDDHLEANRDIGLTEKRVQKIKNDLMASVGIFCVTSFVEQKVKEINKNAITIENGIHLERFAKAKSLKAKLGLSGKKVFGYIGGVEKWTGIKEAIESYLKIKSTENAFIVVGGSKSKYYQDLVQQYKGDIIFLGSIAPEEVGHYFKTLDVGLIPFKLNDFTNNALPIKALEYALGGAVVLSTPLKYLASKNYPFVTFCDIKKFDKCMNKKHNIMEYNFEKMDWKHLGQKLLDFIGKNV